MRLYNGHEFRLERRGAVHLLAVQVEQLLAHQHQETRLAVAVAARLAQVVTAAAAYFTFDGRLKHGTLRTSNKQQSFRSNCDCQH